MYEELITMAIGNGIWAVMFCFLLIFQLKDSKQREQKYQETIKRLSETSGILSDIKADCKTILEEVAKPVKAAAKPAATKPAAAKGK